MNKPFIWISAFLLTSCAVTPLVPFSPTHPASTQASEANIRPFYNSLSLSDVPTKETLNILSKVETETAHQTEKNKNIMSEMPGMNE